MMDERLQTEKQLSLAKSYASNTVLCRICLEPESEENPFEQELCLCSKKMPAHITCIVKWMHKKCEKSSKNNVLHYDLSLLFCDVCKQKYPSTLTLKDKSIPILDLSPLHESSCILLEIFEIDSDQIKEVVIIDLENVTDKQYYVGRNEKNDVVFKDISVSRHHAIIHCFEGRVYVYDQSSKFGTLRLIKEKTPLAMLGNRKVVIDKFLMTFHLCSESKRCACFKHKMVCREDPDDSHLLAKYIEEQMSIK